MRLGKTAHEIDRHQLALVEIAEEDLTEPPQPHHIKNDVYKSLVGEHVLRGVQGFPARAPTEAGTARKATTEGAREAFPDSTPVTSMIFMMRKMKALR